MPSLPPIYETHGKTYQADTCRPVRQAVRAGRLEMKALARGQYPGAKLPRTALPGVKSVGYWDADQTQTWGLDWHRNEGIELTLLESGSVTFAVGEQTHVLAPDDLTVTRPWQAHRVGDPNVGAGRLHWLILDVGVRRPNQAWRWPPWIVLSKPDQKELANYLRHNEQPVWHGARDLQRCFSQIAAAVDTNHAGNALSLLTLRLNELFLLLLELFRNKGVALDQSLSGTLRTVDLFLADLRSNRAHLAEEWSVSDMARSCGLGATQFIRHCKQLTNMTPTQYLNGCRLEAAAALLVAQPKMSVTQVALACGFSTSQYFATAFRRRFGCTPRAYRGKCRDNRLGNRSAAAAHLPPALLPAGARPS